MSSNIRVFVQWKNSTVFAGEDIECTITFKNTALPEGRDKSPIRKANGFAPGGERQRKLPPVHSSTRPSVSRNSSFTSLGGPAQYLRGHRPALSVQTASSIGDRNRSPQPHSGAFNNGSATPKHKHGHGKSLSIISLGTDAATDISHERSASAARRPMRGHGRSASLQVVPGRPSPFPVTSPGHRSVTHYSPRSGGGSPPTIHEPFHDSSLPARSAQRQSGAATGPNTPALRNGSRKPSGSFSQNFKFPASPPPNGPSPERPDENDAAANVRAQSSPKRDISPGFPPESLSKQPTDNLSPIARILSGSSMNGTPRSSGEFYSQSNNSTETLASEYVVPQTARLLPRVFHQRRQSQLVPPNQRTQPETLMMGYAQVMGSFTLDGSLINQAPFEEVKRKGVVGGQGGGGVVGVERTKRESGLFGALGWSNIGESIGGLLGASEPSSIREMRGIANSKTVPLITTPQSILFVDLQLAPGESRSYTYSFTLPRGLPPTHKGRSMKVVYHLTIGTQRPGSARDQQVKHVEIPFRVFGSVNSRGEILGHDLMSPYIILRDQARTCAVNPDSTSSSPSKKPSTRTNQDTANFTEFLDYVDNLLDRPRQNSSMGLLSPTETIPGRSSSLLDEPHTMKESIDLVILRSNLTGTTNQSANRFEIARSGRRVAVIMLARPAYRLGETVSAVIDFTNADIPCYSLHVSLETSEKVDPAIALRSNASIHRVTRKVHASFSENALFAQRLSFSPTIPPSATPDFITSGVSLEWKIRVEFITPRLLHEDGEQAYWDDLLEEVESGERGIVLAAAERLPAESFEVMVPVRVYGAFSVVEDDGDEEGLPV
ncbi:Golgi membrane exchange factor (Ric1p-Rgp1p) subunit [Didymosphaeria variabile]|uniref:Golgi membrane exchange factor (Ric1p-Rgp1p) subunit n=1 Tax=Didymosphaeria variabile TaxID=1932322 RepID=A0A9W8XPZ7_9PLEO|nr:Golgi membrane exchange factor (Ric1p-Rgp1p) subunit [Didymosphaeria variabile]KAJ4356102.1 Golgi membrane exchange factor (Ric1p-Rgp1p) subunit [Didymosphaeria variabile]